MNWLSVALAFVATALAASFAAEGAGLGAVLCGFCAMVYSHRAVYGDPS